MQPEEIDDELSTTGAQELLASTSAAHLAYVGKDGTPRVIPVEHQCRKMYDQMARIAITPRWVRYYDFGAGRMPRFLQELAAQQES
jgi:hypothetical protein